MSSSVPAYLLLGSNLGNRSAMLKFARLALADAAGPVRAASHIYETAAWGREDQPAFLNQAILVETQLAPQALLEACLAVEQAAGRVRQERWGSRTLDVDILLYDNQIISTSTLSIPHPQLALRRFALAPLAELAAKELVPGAGASVRELLVNCPDELPVYPWSKPT